MLRKFFYRKSNTITTAAIVLGVASLVSRLLGILRDRVLASEFGAGIELDMYYAAFRIPDFVFNIVVLGALSAGFIPVFTEYWSNKSKSWQLVNNCLNTLFILLILLCSLLFILAPWLMILVVPGFNESQMAVTVTLTRIMFLSPLLLGISGIFGGVLQSVKQFFIYSLAPIFYNIGIIFGALFLAPVIGIYGLAWGVIIGASLHMIIQCLPVFAHGYRYSFYINWKDKGLIDITKLMIPRALGLAVSQLNLFIVTIFGSTLAVGSIAVFNLAYNIQSFPLGIFAISFAVAAFPVLAEESKHKKKFIETLSLTMRQMLFLIIPSALLLIILRAQVVRVILGAGKFSWENTVLTLETLSLFAISLFAQGLILLLVRAFYALHDSITPFIIGLIGTFANIILALMLIDELGVGGLALAFSLSTVLQLVLLLMFLQNRLGSIDGKKLTISTLKMSLAAFMMALTAQAIKYPTEAIVGTETLHAVLIQMIFSAIGGLLVYLLVSWALKSEELRLFTESLKKRMMRHTNIPPDMVSGEKIT